MEWQQRDALTYKPRKYYLNTISPNCLSIFNFHHLITLPLNSPFWQDIRLSSDPCLSLPKLPAILCFDPTVLYPGSDHPPGESCCHFPAPLPAVQLPVESSRVPYSWLLAGSVPSPTSQTQDRCPTKAFSCSTRKFLCSVLDESSPKR